MAMRSFAYHHRSLKILGIAAFLMTALLFYQLQCQEEIFVSHPYEAVDLIATCATSQPRPKPSDAGTQRIPNTVHQIWKDNNVSTYSIQASHDNWKLLLDPLDYTIKLWTEQDVLRLIQTSYPWLLSTYQSYPYNIQRADVARLAVLHAKGGMYADLDVYPTSAEGIQCAQHLDYEVLLAPTVGNKGMSNHFLMAEKGSKFLLHALHEAKRRAKTKAKRFMPPYLKVLWSTGPLMITSAVHEYSWLYSYAEAKNTMGVFDDRYVRSFTHHAAGRNWHGTDGWALNYMADHVTAEKYIGGGVVFLLAFSYAMRRIMRSSTYSFRQRASL